MASVYCAPPQPLSCTCVTIKRTCSSSPVQLQQTCLRGSAALDFQKRKGIRFRNRPRSRKLVCMRAGKVAVVTGESWDRYIMSNETLVLVEFFASWCGPCRMVHRAIEEIAIDYAGRLSCFVLNTDHDMKIAEDYDIKAVPVVMLFRNGEKQDTVIGTMPKELYVAAIEKILNA